MYVFIMHNLPHHHHHHPLPITLQLAICISALLLMITNTNELMMTHAASTQAEAPLIHGNLQASCITVLIYILFWVNPLD